MIRCTRWHVLATVAVMALCGLTTVSNAFGIPSRPFVPPSHHKASLRATVHPCLASIIDRENPSWDPTVYNRAGSGAYGLPQALPGHKMASAGRDWRTNPVTQIRWMIRYVNERYGGACNAWAFWQRNHWY